MKKPMILVAGALLASPAMAQSDAGHAHHAAAPADMPQKCEMMHEGAMMHGTMVAGEDGTMTCQMMDHAQMNHGTMDHSQMDHGTMDHSQMNHGTMNPGTMDHGQMGHAEAGGPPADEVPPAEPGSEDHSAHQGHPAG